jgi:hypothetical protein
MPKPAVKGVWTEYYLPDHRYPKLRIVHDEKVIAEFHADEAGKFVDSLLADFKKITKRGTQA